MSCAVDAIRSYPENHTLRSFEAAEAAARTAKTAAAGIRLANRYAKEAEDRFRRGSHFQRIWPNEHSDPVMDQVVMLTDPTGKVDFFAAAGSGESVAVMVIGPYTVSRMYSERAADWCLRAFGVASVHRRAALVLPAAAPVNEFEAFLDRLPAEVTRRIEVLRDGTPPGHSSCCLE